LIDSLLFPKAVVRIAENQVKLGSANGQKRTFNIAFIRQRLQGENFTALLGTQRNAVSNGMPSQLIHRVFIQTFQRQITVLGIPHQQSLALQIARQAVRDGVGELCELSAGRCFYPA
jgi:hypothetical protein